MKVTRIDLKSQHSALPVRHLSARVPWHDQKWNGRTCKKVLDNSFCRILSLVDKKKDAEKEISDIAISESNFPPCISEKGTFMSGTEYIRRVVHRYWEMNNPLFRDFGPCVFHHKPFSLNAVPFAWMMKSPAKPNLNFDHTDRPHRSIKAKQYEVNYKIDLEEEIDRKIGFEGNIWIQAAENQKNLLDTFFGCLQKEKSLVFFYAKHTPLSEPNERILIGVARVAQDPGPILDYTFPKNYNGHVSYPWERCIQHTLKPDGMGDGFLLPYHEILEFAEKYNTALDLSEFVARAPDLKQFSYAAEHVEHDTAIDSLLSMAECLRKSREVLQKSFETELEWIDAEISKVWDMRGGFPGMGAILSALGIESGNTIAWEIERFILSKDGDLLQRNPWEIFETSTDEPQKFLGLRGEKLFSKTVRTKWKNKPAAKKTFYKLLSRCQLNNDQAITSCVEV